MEETAAKRLRRLRRNAKMSMRGMAEACGIALSTYSYYEKDGRPAKYLPDKIAQKVLGPLMRSGVELKDIMQLQNPGNLTAKQRHHYPDGLVIEIRSNRDLTPEVIARLVATLPMGEEK